MKKQKKGSVPEKILIIAGWLAVWQLVAALVHNSVMLVGPVETFACLVRLVQTGAFWDSVWYTFWRIEAGFLAGSALGILLAFLAAAHPLVKRILAPFFLALKSVPVASFVILLLIWFGSANLSIEVSFLVVLPILYLNTLEGLESADEKLLEMAEVFHIPLSSKLTFIQLPAVYPFWQSAFALALGMSWKSGVAAEVIGQPLRSVGNMLYQSKIYLETGDLLAWTVVIILISYGVEKLFLALLAHLPGAGRQGREAAAGPDRKEEAQ